MFTVRADTQGGNMTWTYDNADRLLTETAPAGTVSYVYNIASQITSMTAADRARAVRNDDLTPEMNVTVYLDSEKPFVARARLRGRAAKTYPHPRMNRAWH